MKTEEAIIRVLKSRNKQEAGERYRQVMLSINRGEVDWRALNEAIMERWSYSGLEKIKNIAWMGLEGGGSDA